MSPRMTLGVLLGCLALALPNVRAADEPAYANRPLRAWVADLADADVLVRQEALEVVIHLGPSARAALPAVERLAKDPSPVVRTRAAVALWKIDRRTEGLVAAITAGMKGAGPAQKQQLIQVLTELGPAAAEAAPVLVGHLGDFHLRAQAGTALLRMGETGARALADALEQPDPLARQAALQWLARCGRPARPFHPAVARALKHDDPFTRLQAAQALYQLDPKRLEEIIPVVVAAGAHTDESVRLLAVGTALIFRPRPKALAPVLALGLKNPSPPYRLQVAQALAEADPEHTDLVPVLVEAVKARELTNAVPVTQAFATLGPRGRPALPQLVELLRSKESRLSEYQLAEILGRMGPQAVPDLAKLLGDKDGRVRVAAGRGLGHIGAAAVPALAEALDGDDGPARVAAMRGVEVAGPAAKELVPRVVKLLKDDDAALRYAALVALGGLGPAAEAAAPALAEVVGDSKVEAMGRAQAARALGLIGPRARKVLPALTAALKEDDPLLRVWAAEAIGLIDPRDRTGVAGLTAVLREGGARASFARGAAANIIGEMEGEAKEAVPALAEAIRQSKGLERNYHLGALARFGTAAKSAAPAVAEVMNDKDAGVRLHAAITLLQIGAPTEPALDLISEHLRQAPTLRHGVSEGLTRSGPAAAAVLPALLERWKRPTALASDRVHLAAVACAIDPKQKATFIPWLRDLCQTSDQYSRVEAARTLWQIDPKEDVVALLIEALDDGSYFVRGQAVEALRLIGPAAKEAGPSVKKLLEDPEPTIRISAARTLWKVSGDATPGLPVLIETLKEPNLPETQRQLLQQMTLVVLRDLGGDARPAAPAVAEFYRRGPASFRRQALGALEKIDPDEAAKLRAE